MEHQHDNSDLRPPKGHTNFEISNLNENDAGSDRNTQDSQRHVTAFIEEAKDREFDRFNRVAQEMSFHEYLGLVFKRPQHFIRNAAQYTVDAFDAYGSEAKMILGQRVLDFNIKNWPWQSEKVSRPTVLVGQEIPLYEFYLTNKLFAREAHPSRMILFHGPPGGGKTLLAETIDAALEDYSRNNPEGSLYRLVFVFDERTRRKIGFSNGALNQGELQEDSGGHRFVFRPEGNTDPIFLISKDIPPKKSESEALSARESLFKKLVSMGGLSEDFACKDYLLNGSLDSSSALVLEELLRIYDGDLRAVIKNHVRVERWDYSSQLGRGLASVRPNHDWAADIEPAYYQNSMRHMLAPKELAEIERELFTPRAITLGTNRGHLHYADLLRPNERDRGEQDISRLSYLLEMIEDGQVQIMARGRPSLIRTEDINSIIRADSNDIHIRAKSTGSGWEAFRQRCNFITVGLTRRYLEEMRAHEHYVNTLIGTGNLSAHALSTFSLFVTATRLLNPRAEYYTEIHPDLPKLVSNLSVVEKALLLQEPRSGDNLDMNVLRGDSNRLSAPEFALLKRFLNEVAEEYQLGVGETKFNLYEGGLGISTRAAQDLLREVVKSTQSTNVTVLDVINYLTLRVDSESLEYYQQVAEHKAQMEEQLVEADVYALERAGKTVDPKMLSSKRQEAAKTIRERYPIPSPREILGEITKFAKKKVQLDIYSALGVLDQQSHELSLRKYIEHVRAYISGTSVSPEHQTLMGKDKNKPDESLMRDFEERVAKGRITEIDTDDKEAFRKAILRQLGSWRTDYPTDNIDGNLENIFPNLIAGIREQQQSFLHDAMKSFVEVTEHYAKHPEANAEDLKGDKEGRARAEEWERICKKLESLGYPQETIPRHVLWATRDLNLGEE